MSLVFTQILIILLYVLVGYIAGKLRLINPEQRKYLTGLCSDLIVPFTVLSASSQSLGGREWVNLGMVTLILISVYALTTVITLLVSKRRGIAPALTAAYCGLTSYPNTTFLGLPLCRALFGDIAVLYNAGGIVAFDVLFFTAQHMLFTGKRFELRGLVTPTTLSTAGLIVMLALGLHFPAPVQTVVSNIGGMITPMSLIIVGVMLSESPIIEVLRERSSYAIVLLRNLVIPLLSMILLYIAPIDTHSKLCVLVYLSCPCATLTTIYAIREDKEPAFCGRTVLLSTILFAATLPIVIAIGQIVLA